MAELSDHELLTNFARTGAENAFTALVTRHVNLVFSTARRFTSDDHLAEEITQAVFIILARKAGGISARVVLTGWLYQTARLTAANALKENIRRQRREQEAYMESTLTTAETDEAWKQIAPVLDDAMGDLREADRNAVLLRYFENQPLAEVGAALGVSEDAARVRVNRALEKLRATLTKSGVTLGVTAITGAVTANAIQAAPIALTATITAAALTGTSLTLATIAMTTLQKIAATVALTVSVGMGIYQAKQAHDAQNEVQMLKAQQSPMVAQIRNLQTERDNVTNQLAAMAEEFAKNKSNHLELLNLRGEVSLLRNRSAIFGKMSNANKAEPSEVLVTRVFRVDAKAFREKLEEVMQPPANTATAKIASDYFAAKGINLDSPKSIQFADASGSLFVHTTDPDLAKIEKLLGELIPQPKSQLHIKARFIELPKAAFADFSGLFNTKGSTESGLVGILPDEQFRKNLKLLEEKDGFESLGEPEVTMLGEQQSQMRAGDKNSGGPALDITPHLLSDGYTIRLSALVTGPGQLTAEVNVWDNQTLILSKTEKTNPEKQIYVFITTTLVDQAGNRVHSEEDLPFAQHGVPSQE